MSEKNKKIALIGYMVAGKTTLAKELAISLKLPYYDLDTLIESKLGCSISDYLTPKTEIAFRDIERKTLLDWLKNEKNGVLATGGGTPCYYNNMDELLENSLVIFIDLPVKSLVARLANEQESRPLLHGIENIPDFVGAHLFERRPFYNRAHISFFPERENLKDLSEKINSFKN